MACVPAVPSTGVKEGSFETIAIAWKDSIEVARAIAAADPFLILAKKVYLVTVGENTETAASLQQAENYLQLHFAELRSEIVGPSDKSIGETLIGTCEARGRALLVMGAYSHWRWQERVFGGVTEYVLREARTPVLMAHSVFRRSTEMSHVSLVASPARMPLQSWFVDLFRRQGNFLLVVVAICGLAGGAVFWWIDACRQSGSGVDARNLPVLAALLLQIVTSLRRGDIGLTSWQHCRCRPPSPLDRLSPAMLSP